MMRRLARKVGLGLALTCSASTLVLAQVPGVDNAKTKAAINDAQQAKTAADQGVTTAKEGAATAKDTAGAVQKKDVQGVQEGAAKTQKKAKAAKSSGQTSTKKTQDAAKDLTAK
ncbi:MAG TPA: hypothetical protein VKJ47_22480 [Candidatus Binatia bacterium]|nr:hypothetical protein [Candidatus Binatia bacterium]